MRTFLKGFCGFIMLLGFVNFLIALTEGDSDTAAVGVVFFFIGFIPLIVMNKNDRDQEKEEELNKKAYEENYRNSIYRNVPYIDNNSYKFFCPVCGTKLSRDMNCCPECSYKVVLRKEYFKVFQDSFSDDKCAKLYYSSDYYKCTKYDYSQVRQDKGMWGEYYLEGIINGAYGGPHLGFDNRLLFNLLIPEPNGLFQEIDALAIVDGVIFVFEVKNRDGIIEIPSMSSKVWSQHIGKQVHEIHSPIWQNEQHILALKQFIFDKLGKTDIPIINYVVLPDGNTYMDCKITGNGEVIQNPVVEGCIFKCNSQITNIDKVQLNGFTGVTPFSELGKNIHNVMVQIIEKRKRETNQSIVDEKTHHLNLYSEVTMEQLYDLLEPYAHFNEEQRTMYMQAREARIEDTNKDSDFRYGFISSSEIAKMNKGMGQAFPMLIRTNRLYWQKCREDIMHEWVIMSEYEKELIKEVNINWIDVQKYPLKLVEAHYCLQNGSDLNLEVGGILEGFNLY